MAVSLDQVLGVFRRLESVPTAFSNHTAEWQLNDVVGAFQLNDRKPGSQGDIIWRIP
jgi:hypothetical protein